MKIYRQQIPLILEIMPLTLIQCGCHMQLNHLVGLKCFLLGRDVCKSNTVEQT